MPSLTPEPIGSVLATVPAGQVGDATGAGAVMTLKPREVSAAVAAAGVKQVTSGILVWVPFTSDADGDPKFTAGRLAMKSRTV